MVSPCQTQTGPNETQTNLLTGFVSLQTDISWQPERNICENEILDPHVTAGCHMAESRRQFCRNIFFEPKLQRLHFLRVHEPVWGGFAHFKPPRFFLFGPRLIWDLSGGQREGAACKFCAIEGQHFIQKTVHLLYGTILVEGYANGNELYIDAK